MEFIYFIIFNHFICNSIFSEFKEFSTTMKYWLSHLPLEVWVDCYRYPWISREELGRIVDPFRNHKFVEYLQFYLHDWGKRSLKPISFYKQKPHKKKPNPNWHPYMHIPQTPMPTNIRSFESIKISHFEQQTIDFLRRIQPLLQADLNLRLVDITSRNLDNLRTILVNMVPLLDGICSLFCDVRTLPTFGQCFGEKLAQIKTLIIYHEEYAGLDEAQQQETVNFLMNWLTSPQSEGIGPRLCCVFITTDKSFSKKISATIREEFLAAKTSKTFTLVVGFLSDFEEEGFAGFHLNNGIGEELHGVKFEHGTRIQFTRQKANCGADVQDWLRVSEIDISQNLIEISKPTVGLLDAMDAPEDVEKEDGDDDKPSTSKEASIA